MQTRTHTHTHTHTHTVCELPRDVTRNRSNDRSRDYLARHAIARRALGSCFRFCLVRNSASCGVRRKLLCRLYGNSNNDVHPLDHVKYIHVYISKIISCNVCGCVRVCVCVCARACVCVCV